MMSVSMSVSADNSSSLFVACRKHYKLLSKRHSSLFMTFLLLKSHPLSSPFPPLYGIDRWNNDIIHHIFIHSTNIHWKHKYSRPCVKTGAKQRTNSFHCSVFSGVAHPFKCSVTCLPALIETYMCPTWFFLGSRNLLSEIFFDTGSQMSFLCATPPSKEYLHYSNQWVPLF